MATEVSQDGDRVKSNRKKHDPCGKMVIKNKKVCLEWADYVKKVAFIFVTHKEGIP